MQNIYEINEQDFHFQRKLRDAGQYGIYLGHHLPFRYWVQDGYILRSEGTILTKYTKPTEVSTTQ
jgi:hypothetical protein